MWLSNNESLLDSVDALTAAVRGVGLDEASSRTAMAWCGSWCEMVLTGSVAAKNEQPAASRNRWSAQV